MPTLVLGATGKTGRRITARLSAAGHAVRAGARTPGPALPHVEPVHFDWYDAATYGPALDGVETVHVIPPAGRLDHAPHVAAFLEAARAAQVERVVLMTARGVDVSDEIPLRQNELALQATGLPHTIVRPSWFMQNFTEGAFVPGADGVVAAPAGDGPTPFVDAEDIADVAVAALTGDGHAGEVYELSGPEALTWAQAAEVLGARAGRPVRFVDADPDAWVAGAAGAGLPADYAGMMAQLFGAIRAGYEAPLSDGVRRALGREPRSLAAFAEREAALLRQAPAAVA
ncbi:MAG: hypothetical protein AVDCRST_MAG13-1351 [uncultured Solirubrobacteraceae bacterium]|uniref:NAD(P)-binding domain-containing protein n=1 Tax=uncultured Solirubrobacteraceae bacterium TaxID=1162706 RepID=A0A6J4RXE0_9ACTN|nr:MAG: hypothetical protein AVDCRST_MAG13-1351 [uncultured Solirubrobacteraceae bacterium]